MSRRRKSNGIYVRPWESANLDNSETIGYAKIGTSLLLKKEFQDLGYSTCMLFIQMLSACQGKQEFSFSHGDAKRRGFPSSTYELGVKKLIGAGYIERVEDEERAQFAKTKYRFILDFKTNPAPKNWGPPSPKSGEL